jgi:PDZ domain-containing protein
MFEPDWERSEPPGAKPVKGSSLLRTILLIALGVVILAAAFLVPIPIFYAYLPGPVRDVEKLVEVSGAQTYSSEGELLLTTVSVDPQVTLAEMIQSQWDDASAIVFKEDVTGGQSFDQLLEDQRQQMVDSKRRAQEVALAALGLGNPEGDGARVADTEPGSPAEGELQAGDVIREVDGEPVSTTCDVGREIDEHEVGEDVTVTFERDGEVDSVTLQTAPMPTDEDEAYIGIYMRDVNYRFDPGVDVEFDTGKIGGPSAGLMMTLALYDRLTPDDLTSGRKVAGTGTIACDGGVGAIGGIEQKVAAAEREGSDVFLAPEANAAAARRVAGDIEIVSVSDFAEAVDYLEGLE